MRSYNSLAVAANVIVDYPIQAVMLSRASFEAILIADHVTPHPEDQRYWMDPKYDDSQKRRVPGSAAMLRDTDTEDLLNEVYHLLSLYAHPTTTSLAAERERNDGKVGVVTLHVGPRRDIGLSLLALFVLLYLTRNLLRIVNELGDWRDPEWRRQLHTLIQEMQAWFDLTTRG